MNYKELIRVVDKSRSEKAVAIQKAKSVAKGKPRNIKNFAILTGQNPNTEKASNGVNRRNNKELRVFLKQNNIDYVPVYGKYGGIPEDSYMLLNPGLQIAHDAAAMFSQTSFIYGEATEEGLIAYYWELEDKNKPYSEDNDYVNKDEIAHVEDRGDEEDNFSRLGKELKFSFPFSIFA